MSDSAPVRRIREEFDGDPQDFAGDVFVGRKSPRWLTLKRFAQVEPSCCGIRAAGDISFSIGDGLCPGSTADTDGSLRTATRSWRRAPECSPQLKVQGEFIERIWSRGDLQCCPDSATLDT